MKERNYINEHGEIYLFLGFLNQDGHIKEDTRNRGSLRIELSAKDSEILLKLKDLHSGTIRYRKRDTNFAKNYETCTLSFYTKEFRDKVKEDLASKRFHTNKHFLRGEFDADGSCGVLTGKASLPFASIVLTNDEDYLRWKNYLEPIIGRSINVNPNKRDGVRNVMVKQEQAQLVLEDLYGGSEMYLERKYSKYKEIMQWERPADMAFAGKKTNWDEDQDNYILSHSIEDSMLELDRTESSIKNRLWRLRSKK